MLTKKEILSRLDENKPSLAKYGVRRVALFGSFVRNQGGDDSDIDLLVEFAPGQETFDNFINICYFFDGIYPGSRVDVVTTEGLSPYIGPHIKNEAQYV